MGAWPPGRRRTELHSACRAIEGIAVHVPTDRLKGKICVITGAASTLGEAVAKRLASEGATVIGVDRRDHSVGMQSLRSELAYEDEVRRVFADIKRDFGRIDVLYNNVGLNDPDDHSALEASLEVWDRVLTANRLGRASRRASRRKSRVGRPPDDTAGTAQAGRLQ